MNLFGMKCERPGNSFVESSKLNFYKLDLVLAEAEINYSIDVSKTFVLVFAHDASFLEER